MATPDLPPDLTATQWRDDEWLASWPLNAGTALDYFSRSPFYDRACANEAARAQGLGLDQLALMPAGPEYVLASAEEPHLYIIHRRWRGAPGAAPVPQAVYYILGGAAYEAPAVGAVLAARLDRCLWTIRAAFGRMQADLDPLAAAEKRALAAAAAAAPGGGGGAAPGPARPPPPPPPRRYTQVERARMETADRVVGAVLRGLDEKEREEREAEVGGGGEENDAAPPPPALPPGPLLEGGPAPMAVRE